MRNRTAFAICPLSLAARPLLLAAGIAVSGLCAFLPSAYAASPASSPDAGIASPAPAAASSGPGFTSSAPAAASPDPGSATPAPPAGPSISVKPGFAGAGKIGDWLPVTVDVSNQGSSVAGELQIEIDDSASGAGARGRGFGFRPPTVYTVPASLPSNSSKQYEIDVFLPFLTKSLTVKLMTNQGLLVQQSAPLQALSSSDVLCGALSPNRNFFQLLQNVDLPGRQGKKPIMVAMNPDDLPARQHALASLDCLVVNNVSLMGLTNDQKMAIWGWVDDGGLLIATGGSGWQKTLQPLPQGLLPVAPTGVKAVQSLQSLSDFTRQSFQGKGPWLVTSSRVTDGNVVLQQEGVPILVGARRGKGTVLYLAADPTSEPLNTWGGNGALWSYLMSYTSTPLAVYPFFNAFGGFNSIQNWGIPPRAAIYNVAGVDPPSGDWLLIFMGVYALIAGPLNFLVLRLIDRKELGWITVPLIIAGGVFVSFKMVQQYKGSDLILNKISLVRGEGDTTVANVRSYVALYSPRQGDYQVDLPANASVTSFAAPGSFNFGGQIPNQSNAAWRLKVDEGDTASRVEMDLQASSTGTFFADHQMQMAGAMDSTLQVQGNRISGQITNHTGQSMDQVVLIVGQDLFKAGSMANGQSRNVNFTFNPNAPSGGPSATAVKSALAAQTSPDDATTTNRLSILDAFLGSNASSQPAGLSGLTVLGWLKQSPLPISVQGFHPSVKETNLYATRVALSFSKENPVVVPPALVETKQIGTFSTNFQREGQYELNPSGSLALEFGLPLRLSQLVSNKLVLHMDGRYAGNPREPLSAKPGDSLGQIFLFNWQSANWDPQPFTWGENVIPDPTRYVSATNALRVRYTYKPPAQQPTDSIQFSLNLTDEGTAR